VSDATQPSDSERVESYALLGRLFGTLPDAALLTRIAQQQVHTAAVAPAGARAWRWLQGEAQHIPLPVLQAEYGALFGGSEPLISLHGSHYAQAASAASGYAGLFQSHRQSARVALATELAEDHLAVVCATMELLIRGIEGLGPAPVSLQKLFFSHHIAPWFKACCSAIRDCPIAEFYRIGAEWAQAFLERERAELAKSEA
jgi:TorA maturation chaperone TorD